MKIPIRDEAHLEPDDAARPLSGARPPADTPKPNPHSTTPHVNGHEPPRLMFREDALRTAPRAVVKRSNQFWQASLVSVLLYVIVWFFVSRIIGVTSATAALLMLPVVAAGWFWGLRAALVAVAVSLVVNSAFLSSVLHIGWRDLLADGGITGMVAVLLMSLGLGRLRDLSERVRAHDQQLQREHETLKAQVAEREWAEAALRESEERYRLMVEGSEQVFFYTHDVEHRFEYLSPSVQAVLGYRPEELIGQPYDTVLTDDPINKTVTQLTANALQHGQRATGYVARVRRKNDRAIYLELVESPLRRGSKIVGIQGFARDITERVEAERLRQILYEVTEAAHEMPDLPTLFQSIHRSLGKLLDVKNFYIALSEGNRLDLFSFPYMVDEHDTYERGPQLIPGSLLSHVAQSGKPLLADKARYNELVAARVITAPGTAPVSWLGVPLELNNTIIGVVVAQSYSDAVVYSQKDLEIMEFVSTQIAVAIERKRAEQALIESRESLKYLAHHDPLTSLPNRLLFYERLSQATAQVRRHNSTMALLYVDLDQFKLVNDLYGHDAGDLVLQEVANRLRSCIREVDTVARMGGDEFTIILAGITNPQDAALVAQKILGVLALPYLIKEHQLNVTASIGGTIFKSDDADIEALVKHADKAMYRAKRTGNHYHQFGTTADLISPT